MFPPLPPLFLVGQGWRQIVQPSHRNSLHPQSTPATWSSHVVTVAGRSAPSSFSLLGLSPRTEARMSMDPVMASVGCETGDLLRVVSFDPHSKPEPLFPYRNRETGVSIQISTHTHSLSLSLCVQVCVCINMGGTHTHLCVCACVCTLIYLCLRACACISMCRYTSCECRPEVHAGCFFSSHFHLLRHLALTLSLTS